MHCELQVSAIIRFNDDGANETSRKPLRAADCMFLSALHSLKREIARLGRSLYLNLTLSYPLNAPYTLKKLQNGTDASQYLLQTLLHEQMVAGSQLLEENSSTSRKSMGQACLNLHILAAKPWLQPDGRSCQ